MERNTNIKTLADQLKEEEHVYALWPKGSDATGRLDVYSCDKTKELISLVPHGLKYLETTHRYASDPDNTKYMMRLPNETPEETKVFLEIIDKEWQKQEPSFYEFAVLLGEVHIGAASAYLSDDRTSAELGWIIDKKYWGQGYGYEAAKKVVDFCRKELNVQKVIAHCDTENTGSYRIMEKLGMKRICINEGRKNRAAEKLSQEYQYEMSL